VNLVGSYCTGISGTALWQHISTNYSHLMASSIKSMKSTAYSRIQNINN